MFPTILLSALALGGWGTGSCDPVGPPVSSFMVSRPAYDWRTRDDDPARQYLFRDGVQVGGWDATHGVFRHFDAATGAWSEPEPPPWARGDGTARVPGRDREQLANFGVDVDKLGGRTDSVN